MTLHMALQRPCSDTTDSLSQASTRGTTRRLPAAAPDSHLRTGRTGPTDKEKVGRHEACLQNRLTRLLGSLADLQAGRVEGTIVERLVRGICG